MRSAAGFSRTGRSVFIELEAAPWVWRVAEGGAVPAHDGRPALVQALFTDEQGRVFMRTDIGFGIVHTQDVALVADAVEAPRGGIAFSPLMDDL